MKNLGNDKYWLLCKINNNYKKKKSKTTTTTKNRKHGNALLLVRAYLPYYAQRSSHISKKYVRELKKYGEKSWKKPTKKKKPSSALTGNGARAAAGRASLPAFPGEHPFLPEMAPKSGARPLLLRSPKRRHQGLGRARPGPTEARKKGKKGEKRIKNESWKWKGSQPGVVFDRRKRFFFGKGASREWGPRSPSRIHGGSRSGPEGRCKTGGEEFRGRKPSGDGPPTPMGPRGRG